VLGVLGLGLSWLIRSILTSKSASVSSAIFLHPPVLRNFRQHFSAYARLGLPSVSGGALGSYYKPEVAQMIFTSGLLNLPFPRQAKGQPQLFLGTLMM